MPFSCLTSLGFLMVPSVTKANLLTWHAPPEAPPLQPLDGEQLPLRLPSLHSPFFWS